MIQVIISVVEIILRERTISRITDVRESCKAKSFGYVFNALGTTFKSVQLESSRIHHDDHALKFQFIQLRHKISKCTFNKKHRFHCPSHNRQEHYAPLYDTNAKLHHRICLLMTKYKQGRSLSGQVQPDYTLSFF